jgi:hypothetical protein
MRFPYGLDPVGDWRTFKFVKGRGGEDGGEGLPEWEIEQSGDKGRPASC